MDAAAHPWRALEGAVGRLLRPLARILLRHGFPFAAFQEAAKRAFVEAAMEDFALPGRKASISRASILTGLTRKDVQRLCQRDDRGDEAVERYNRATRVLTAWARDRDFLDDDSLPRALPIEGVRGFAELVRRHSGDMPARAVLDELVRVGAVEQRENGLVETLTRGAYVPQQGTLDKIGILGSDVADLIATIDHNLEYGAEDPRFQRKVMYHAFPVVALPAFRALVAKDAQALLERLDRWLAAHDDDPPESGDDVEHARVGLGIHYFEQPLDRRAGGVTR